MNNCYKLINFSSLNCKGLKGNLLYSQHLTEISDLTYFNETWTYPDDLNIVKDIAKSSNRHFYHKSDMSSKARGRPFGGQLWFINKLFKIIECNFLCRHSSYVNFSINEFEFLCVGLYMPFDNSKDRANSKATFEITLSRILALIERHKEKNIPIILMGDFNSDIHRNNRFDVILKNFITDNNMILLDHINNNHITHTFTTAKINNTYFYHNLDHFILYSKNSLKTLIDSNFLVFEDIANMSDHRAINYSFSLDTHDFTTSTQPEQVMAPENPNFDVPEILIFYQSKIEEKIQFLRSQLQNEACESQEFCDQLYLSTCDIFTISANETLDFQKNFFNSSSLQEHPKSKKKKKSTRMN